MEYPLELSFKIFALTPQISVTDASGRLVFYVKLKMFKLKDLVTIFADEAQTQPIYHINADRIIDLGPGAADEGGNVIAFGTPEEVAKQPQSFTGRYLAEALAANRVAMEEVVESD